MNEMRRLMEAVQLNEYLVREGDSIADLLQLNVFGDMGLREDPELFTDDPDDGVAVSPEWIEVLRDYQGEAEERMLQIQDEAEKGRDLTNAEAQAAENTWYDGSDAYQSEEEAVEWLPDVYANQLNVIENILHGLIDDEEEGDYAPFGEGIDEAFDDEVDGPAPSGSSDQILRELVRELQKLERNTARVFTEMTRSRMRADFSRFAINEFSETLTDITDLVEKYEDFG